MTRTLEAIFTTHHLLHNLQMGPNKLYIMLIMKGFLGTNTSLLGQLLSSEENRVSEKYVKRVSLLAAISSSRMDTLPCFLIRVMSQIPGPSMPTPRRRYFLICWAHETLETGFTQILRLCNGATRFPISHLL
jgi:hypothetical protein